MHYQERGGSTGEAQLLMTAARWWSFYGLLQVHHITTAPKEMSISRDRPLLLRRYEKNRDTFFVLHNSHQLRPTRASIYLDRSSDASSRSGIPLRASESSALMHDTPTNRCHNPTLLTQFTSYIPGCSIKQTPSTKLNN